MTTATLTRAPSRGILIAAWIFPVMILTGWAFLGGIPVLVVLIKALRQRVVQLWAAGLTIAYAVPVAIWLLGPSDAPSLSKFLSPTITYLLAAIGVIAAIAVSLRRREVQ